MRRPARGLTQADETAWAQYASKLAPLRGRTIKKPLVVQPLPNAPVVVAAAAPALPKRAVKTKNSAATLTVGDQPGGIDKATWHRFQSGRLVTTRRLDLHGMTAQRAFQALLLFLRTAHAEQARCVEVITGRGSGDTGGVIRREFPHWLNLPEIRPLILGAAHPHALNPGSVRLILRRIR